MIRILTHEIMNSITPISSLTETMLSLLTDKNGNQKAIETMNDDSISDIRFSLNTIQNRSEGLLHFVENYRKLTRVPKPVPEPVNIRSFLLGIEKLMKDSLQRHDIDLSVTVGDGSLKANFDPSLMEQVLINLITNSTHALEGCSTRQIHIKGYHADNSVIMEIADTGKGIPEKDLKEIFIPFFSLVCQNK